MATPARDKYYLKTLHEEIDLYDRKLAHLEKFETFSDDEARELAIKKMTTKRNTLVRTAREIVEEGIEFKAADLPRSFREQSSQEAKAA